MLGQAYNYAITSDPAKLSRAPKIERYGEQGNERKGKFTPAEAEAMFNSLPPYMADVARFAYETGHRSSEIRKLCWSHLEPDAIRVPGRIAKNRSCLYEHSAFSFASCRHVMRLAMQEIFHELGIAA